MTDSKRIAPRSARAALEPDRVPPVPARQRSKRARHPFVIAGNLFLTVVFLLTIAAGVGFVIGKQRFDVPGPLTEDKVVNIPRGGIRDTADLLVKEGVIDQPYVFIGGALLLKARNDLKYGEYLFPKRASLREVVDTIMEGKVVQHNFTVAEGLTSDQVVQKLLENPVLTGNIREIPREGTLLPETYRFTRGMTREDLIKRMQEAQRKAVQEIWERRMPDLPLRSLEQLVILASIIEKETGRKSDRPMVAAVFANRLRVGMPLQTDPTVIYGMGENYAGRIRKKDLQTDTPYNTYTRMGLPPTPISLPGVASLQAAMNPAQTTALYFVSRGDGSSIFSDTLGDHNKAVDKYIRGQ